MKSRLQDWITLASGPVYSAATLDAAEVLSRSRRRQVRKAIYRGELPADRDGLRYATALARDLDRMRPRGESRIAPRLVGGGFVLLAAGYAAAADWALAAAFAIIGAFLGGSSVVRRRRLVHLRPVILAGYDRFLVEDRTFFDHAVREPAPITERQLALGYLAWLPWVGLAGVFGMSLAGQALDGPSESWSLVALVFVSGPAGALFGSWHARRRYLRELLSEPRPDTAPDAAVGAESPGGQPC